MPDQADAAVAFGFPGDASLSSGVLNGFWSDCVSYDTAAELMVRAAHAGRDDFIPYDTVTMLAGWLLEHKGLSREQVRIVSKPAAPAQMSFLRRIWWQLEQPSLCNMVEILHEGATIHVGRDASESGVCRMWVEKPQEREALKQLAEEFVAFMDNRMARTPRSQFKDEPAPPLSAEIMQVHKKAQKIRVR